MIICKLELEWSNITNLPSLIKSVLVIKPGGKFTLIKLLREKKKICDRNRDEKLLGFAKVSNVFYECT